MTPLKINLVQHLGKGITHLKGGKKFQCAKTEFLFVVLFTILCLKLLSLDFSLVSCTRDTSYGSLVQLKGGTGLPLKQDACQGWDPNWQDFLLCQRFSTITVFSHH